MDQSFRSSVFSALILAFASFGDAFLYSVLPVNFLSMGIPVAWVGFLLSINRFIRLLANHLFAFLFGVYGFKKITIVAAVFAAATTLIYGITASLVLWIVARIIWGFCFSALRISSISYSLESKRKGFSLGLNKGLQETGPILALIIGPLLLKWTNLNTTFMIFSMASAFTVFIGFKLPELKPARIKFSFDLNILPSSFNLLTFLSSLIVQGILVVVIGRLFIDENISVVMLTSLSAFYLAYRRICTIIVSPLAGWYADSLGINKVYVTSIIFTIIGLTLICIGYIKIGIILTFTFNSISSALSPGGATSDALNQLKAVALNSTWSDIGAALGALIGGAILHLTNFQPVFATATLTLLSVLVFYIVQLKYKTSRLIEWK